MSLLAIGFSHTTMLLVFNRIYYMLSRLTEKILQRVSIEGTVMCLYLSSRTDLCLILQIKLVLIFLWTL